MHFYTDDGTSKVLRKPGAYLSNATALETDKFTAYTSSKYDLTNQLAEYKEIYIYESGFGGLGVACWPLVPKFAGSNPAEAVGFLGAKKSSARLPSEGK